MFRVDCNNTDATDTTLNLRRERERERERERDPPQNISTLRHTVNCRCLRSEVRMRHRNGASSDRQFSVFRNWFSCFAFAIKPNEITVANRGKAKRTRHQYPFVLISRRQKLASAVRWLFTTLLYFYIVRLIIMPRFWIARSDISWRARGCPRESESTHMSTNLYDHVQR